MDARNLFLFLVDSCLLMLWSEGVKESFPVYLKKSLAFNRAQVTFVRQRWKPCAPKPHLLVLISTLTATLASRIAKWVLATWDFSFGDTAICAIQYIFLYMKIVFRGHTAPLASWQTHSICVSFIKWLRTLYDPHFAYLSLAICSCSSVLGNAGKREKSQSTKMSRARFEMRQAHSVPSFFPLYVSAISRAVLLKSTTPCHQAVASVGK